MLPSWLVSVLPASPPPRTTARGRNNYTHRREQRAHQEKRKPPPNRPAPRQACLPHKKKKDTNQVAPTTRKTKISQRATKAPPARPARPRRPARACTRPPVLEFCRKYIYVLRNTKGPAGWWLREHAAGFRSQMLQMDSSLISAPCSDKTAVATLPAAGGGYGRVCCLGPKARPTSC